MALALGLVLAGFRLEASGPVTNYLTRFWQMENGLPENNVTSVLQTRDGYIWLGTRNGLARFDGVRFTVFDSSNTPEMRSRHVTCLFEASDGTLWIGHESGEVLMLTNGKFREVHTSGSWRGGSIFRIAEDESRRIWLLNREGELARADDGLVIASAPGGYPRLLALAQRPHGGFWVQRDNEVTVLKDGRLAPITFDTPTASRYIQGVGASRDGGLWVMTERRIRKWKDDHWAEDLGAAPWGWSPAHWVLETRKGVLAAATVDFGLFLAWPGGALQYNRSNGFSSDWITCVCEDREGNLWAGTRNGGLAMLRSGILTTLNPPDQWQGRSVVSVAATPDDTVWIGTDGAGVYRYGGGEWTKNAESAGVANRYVLSVAVDAQGRPWAGTWGGGVFVQGPTGFSRVPALENLQVGTMTWSADGSLLLGTAGGLLRYEAGEAIWLARRPELPSSDVRTIAETVDGAVWLGTSGGGLASLKAGRLRKFGSGEGLSSEFVQCLHPEPDGTLWIGTFGGGLNRLKQGRFSSVTRRHGLPNDVICDIQEDRRGFFWISSHGGITRVARAELERCADGQSSRLQCQTYGLSDGLPTLECSGGFQPAGCQTSDGHLWFPTAKGLVRIEPANVSTNHLPPPVLIEELRIDGRVEAIPGRTGAGAIRVPPGRRRLEINYTALSFVAPERVTFKYRLDGLEKDWQEAGSARMAVYSYLPPAHYTFHVIACNSDGVWNETGADLAFMILPHFWQTWWFRALGAVLMVSAGGGAVWLDSRRRMRRKLERLERQQALERERARIAKDIHDDLGASLTRISLLSQSARRDLEDPVQAAVQLERVSETARELTRAMDEIVWAVNPQHDTLDSLASYLGKFAQDFLRSAGIRCRLNVPVELPHCLVTADVRHNLFLACKEALHNVVKHSRASIVRISLALNPDGFSLVIEDNGCGFDPQAFANGAISCDPDRLAPGYGLVNMKRRLADIGGEWKIEGIPQSGTRVQFDVRLQRDKA